MSNLDDAAFARPFSEEEGLRIYDLAQTGLTKREYAAIHLRVPRSGDEELDAMIREEQRNELARAMQLSMLDEKHKFNWSIDKALVARVSYDIADAMLKERKK